MTKAPNFDWLSKDRLFREKLTLQQSQSFQTIKLHFLSDIFRKARIAHIFQLITYLLWWGLPSLLQLLGSGLTTLYTYTTVVEQGLDRQMASNQITKEVSKENPALRRSFWDRALFTLPPPPLVWIIVNIYILCTLCRSGV